MNWKKGCLFFVVAFALLILFLIVGGAWVVNSRFAPFTDAPRIDQASLVSGQPSVRVLFDPAFFKERLLKLFQERAQEDIPKEVQGFLEQSLESILPYTVSAILSPDYDKGRVDVHLFINERRFGPVIADVLNTALVTPPDDAFGWPVDGWTFQKRGVVTNAGSIAMDSETQETVWYQWNHSTTPAPLALEGNHLLEVVADNRDGGAYLIAASLMKVYDYNLDEEQEDISFTSFQFVENMRLTIDVEGKIAKIRMAMTVQPEHKDKIAVVNLKVALDKAFDSMGKELHDKNGIEFRGTSKWFDNVVVYEYTLDDLDTFIDLAQDGELGK